MRRISLNISIIAGLLILLGACHSRSLFDEYRPIPKARWDKDSLMVFEVPVSDVNVRQNHNLFVNVRNDINYKYSNLWLFVKITQPGDTTVTDTFEVTLADPTGKWLGKGFGGIKTNENLFRQNVFFPKPGTYKFEVQHGMRGIVIEGITDIGIRLERK